MSLGHTHLRFKHTKQEKRVPKYGDGSPGHPLPAFSLDMTDDALVTLGTPTNFQGPTATASFTDVGFMPVTPQSIAGAPLHLPGWADGLFIRYTSDGLQNLYDIGTASTPNYVPTVAIYADLHYELVAYKGNASFGHGPNGTPTVAGILKEAVVAQGDLIAGSLGVDRATHAISGDVLTTLQLGNQTVGNLDIAVSHAASDVGPAPSGFTLSGGALHATFIPMATTNN
jgi:hypothetical protein